MSSALRKLSRAQSHFRRTVSWALLLALLGCTGSSPGALAAPRGSKYGEDLGRNSFIAAPTLRAISPNTGMKEGGALVTISGSGFVRSSSLKVKFSAVSPKLEIDTVSATFVDSTTIVAQTPRRSTAHVVHVTVANDGNTYSALPVATHSGSGSYLLYTYLSLTPWGPWKLHNHTLSSAGNATLTVFLDGKYTDGIPDGSTFHDSGTVYCAAGPSRRQVFSRFTPVRFIDAEGTTLNADSKLTVESSVRDEYNYFIATDYTYEVVVVASSHTQQWRWRKWAVGMYPSGMYSEAIQLSTATIELELGVRITFDTTSNKNEGDKWQFDVLMSVPKISKATVVSERTIQCDIPPPDLNMHDADPEREGFQQELKVSVRGNNCFSPPTYVDKDGRRSATGATKHLGNETEALQLDEDIKLLVEGYFTGPEEYTFELIMNNAFTFKWRKYRLGSKMCVGVFSGPWCSFKGTGTVSTVHAVHLEHGVYARFASTAGKQSGDRWTFDAYTFWSTSFSPVTFIGSDDGFADDSLMYVQGTFTGQSGHMIYEIEVMADTSTFRWRKFTYVGSNTVDVWEYEHVPFTTLPTLLDSGVYVYWLTPTGKQEGNRWIFSGYGDRLITWYTKSYVSDAVPFNSNQAGDPRVPTITGTYLEQLPARLRVEIGGECTTSCNQFRWIKEFLSMSNHNAQPPSWSGGEFSPLTRMQSVEQRLTDGINITWGPTSGYVKNNVYTIDVWPLPTSTLPVRPAPSPFFSPLGLRSTYHDGTGKAPVQNAVLTIEFVSSTHFKWRKNTLPYSQPIAVSTVYPITITNGVNLTFTAGTGHTPGTRYLIPLRVHVPRVINVTTSHNGPRQLPKISQPVPASTNYANLPNQGSLLGGVRPWHKNHGNHSIIAVPTAGNSRGGMSATSSSGVTQEKGIGLSNVINSVPTQGYLTASYPTTFIEIVGTPDVSIVSGPLADEMIVSGIYDGQSSYVYEVEPFGADTMFRWRKYPLGMSNSNATTWSTGHSILMSGSTPLDNNLSVSFISPSYLISASTKWTFTANKGHSFMHRDAGRASWSHPIIITGQAQQLSSGVSVQFAKLSGYRTGDKFVIHNRTIDSYGTYTGETDIEYTVEIVGARSLDVPTFHRTSGSTSTGLQSKLALGGTYAGSSTYIFEIVIFAAGDDQVSLFTWRKFPQGCASGGGPFSAFPKRLSLSPISLDDGIVVSWAAITGHSVGDTWRFTAHAGDTFRWKQASSSWSVEQRISNIGLVEGDFHNQGKQVPNVDVKAVGDYIGDSDNTIVLEVLADGSSFRWKKQAYIPLAGAFNASGTKGSYCCGTEDVMYDETHIDGFEIHEIGRWSTTINMVALVPTLLCDGVHVIFVTTTGHVPGDLYYIPVKTSTRHKMSHGVHLAFGDYSGYSPGDTWTLTATAAVAARGPLGGNTEIIVKGYGFLPSEKLRCRLTDSRTLHTVFVPAQYHSADELHCLTAVHPPDTIEEPVFSGTGNDALHVHGIYTGRQTIKITIRMVSATTFQWRSDAQNNNEQNNAAWSVPLDIQTSLLIPLQDGMFLRFSSEGGYLYGDTWAFVAHFVDTSNVNNHPNIHVGSIRPGIMKHVAVSNDGGITWSSDDHGLTRFLFSDIYVSVSGDDAAGDGTRGLPYRTIQRAIHAALTPSTRGNILLESGFIGNMANNVNVDSIMVAPGRYAGYGNVGLFAMGKILLINSEMHGEAAIDCMGGSSADVHDGKQSHAVSNSGSVHLRGINTENCGIA